jgi:hypothetical protein
VVGAEDVLEAVAVRARVPVSTIKSVLETKPTDKLEIVAKELATNIPVVGREWAEALTAYLADCTADDAEKLAEAIRAAKVKLGSQ